MMNFKNKAVFTAILAMIALMMVFAAGCQSVPAAKDNNPNAIDNSTTSLDLAKGTSYSSDQNPGSSGISVSGQGSVSLKPDVAYIVLGVETQNVDFGKSRQANNEVMAKVIAAIKGFGVGEDDITTTNFSIYPIYDDKQKITGYRVSNTVNVKVKNLDKLGDVITAATAAGANTSYGINFDILDRTAAYNEALAEAMSSAKARADLMAKALGVTLGKVLTVSESSGYSGPVFARGESAMDSAKAIGVPTASGQMDVTASVSVVYEIVK